MNIKDKLKAARRPEKVVQVCLRGDLQADFDQTKRELDGLAETPGDALNAGTQRRELQDRLRAIRDEMADASVDFRLRAVSRPRWSELVAKFPPRDGNARDKMMGVNEDELAAAIIREGIVDPELDDEDWAALEDALTESQYLELGNAAWELNKAPVSVPFLPTVSPTPRNSASG